MNLFIYQSNSFVLDLLKHCMCLWSCICITIPMLIEVYTTSLKWLLKCSWEFYWENFWGDPYKDRYLSEWHTTPDTAFMYFLITDILDKILCCVLVHFIFISYKQVQKYFKEKAIEGKLFYDEFCIIYNREY